MLTLSSEPELNGHFGNRDELFLELNCPTKALVSHQIFRK